MADIDFSVESSVGNIMLDTDGSGNYGITDKTLGFGVPPVIHRFHQGAGVGGKRRNTRVGMRPIDLGVMVLGAGRLDLGEKVRTLAKVMRTLDPDPKLIAQFSDGTRYELPFVYQSGLEIDYQSVQGNTFEAVVSLMAGAPYWIAQQESSTTLQQAGAGRGLIKTTSLAKMRVSDSAVIGTTVITNGGDVPSPVIYQATGPMNYFEVVSPYGTFKYNAVIAALETITIDTEQGTVVNQLGVNKYINMADNPQFFSLPPGPTTLNINTTGADGNTRVVIRFKKRREVIL